MITNSEEYPMLSVRGDTDFAKDLQRRPMIVNGKPMNQGVWNLLISKRDLTMWVKHKMKPNRHWKVSQVKKYFGIKGNGEKLLAELLALKEEVNRYTQREE